MPKNITRVKWRAGDIPFGVSFNEQNGTFSGEPEDEGEYIIPVSVETNYGKDTKDVRLRVNQRLDPYPVYAIGTYASTWSNKAEPDANGFRRIDMPEAVKLLVHPNGFGAKTADNKYYCCGATGINTSGSWPSAGQAIILSNLPIELPDVEQVATFGFDNGITNPSTSKPQYSFVGLMKRMTDGTIQISRSCVTGSTGSDYIRVNKQPGMGVSSYSCSHLPDAGSPVPSYVGSQATGTALYTWLSNDGTIKEYAYISLLGSGSSVAKQELGYRAIKMFANYIGFDYLSEDKYINDDPSIFPHGNILNAWVYFRDAIVLTDMDEVYTYDYINGTWNYEGTYPVKKILITYYINPVYYMLTKDGKLYHKGAAVPTVTDKHDEFTQIYAGENFKDITSDGTTLVVLKE